ncbi:Hint domain-containing protein [Roseovarius aestuarii]|nr:Hint domain-containing protein [Roseovarius aestuarii]
MPVEKIINGDFSSGLGGWTINNPTGGAGPVIHDPGKVSFNSSNESVYGDSIEQSFTAAIGRTQTVQMDLIENNTGVSNHSFLIEIIDSDGAVIASQNYTVLNNSTVHVNFTFVPTTATSTIRITNTNATNSVNTDGKVDNVSITCFTRGCHIDAEKGPTKIEDLKVGDRIMTSHNGSQPVRWIGSRKITAAELRTNPKLRPVRIMAGALGQGLPQQDLLVSRQHRMLISSKIAERMFGTREVLIPAIKLVGLPGVFVDASIDEVEYFHILFDQHEVVFAEAAPSESLFAGEEALKTMSSEARQEIIEIFPELACGTRISKAACLIPPNVMQKKLVQRHARNRKPLLQAYHPTSRC